MKKLWLIILLLLAFHLFLLSNLQFTAWPEMFSYPYFKNHGFLLYKDMIHPYPPLLTLALSYVYKSFGYQLEVLQVFAWFVALASSILVYLITKTITKRELPSLVALFSYVVLQPFLEGNMLWFDAAIVPALLLGTLFLLRNNLFLSGVFFASAGFIKQTGGIFYLAILLFLLLQPSSLKRRLLLRLKRVAPFLGGTLLFGVPLFVRLVQEGALGGFLRWVVFYPMTEWGKFPGYIQMSLSGQQWQVLVALFLPTLVLVVWNRLWKDSNTQLLLLLTVAGLIAVYPRFSYFHLQPALAFLVLLYGYLFRLTMEKKVLALLFLTGVFLFNTVHLPVLKLEWGKQPSFYSSQDLALAQDIAEIVPRGEKVFLLGVDSGIYVMADRVPPKRWTDNFGWYLEIPGVQGEIISRWEQSPPRYVVWRAPSQGNWFDLGTYQPKKIVDWIEQNYIKENELRPGIWVWRRGV